MTAFEDKLHDILDKCITQPDVIYSNFRNWFLQQFHCPFDESCTIESFAIQFIQIVRDAMQQTTLSLNKWPFDDNHEMSPKPLTSASVSASNSFSTLTPSHKPSKHRSFTHFSPRDKMPNAMRSKPPSRNSVCLGDFLDFDSPSKIRSSKKKQQSQIVVTNQKSTEKQKTPKQRIALKDADGKQKPEFVRMLSGGKNAVDSPASIPQTTVSNASAVESVEIENMIPKDTTTITNQIHELALSVEGSDSPHIASIAEESDLNKLDESFYSMNATSQLNIKDQPRIELLARIYSLFIDLNFTSSVINEITYFFTIFNMERPEDGAPAASSSPTPFQLQTALNDIDNCIYFASCLLDDQRFFLSSLDVSSLEFILETERLSVLLPELSKHLKSVHAQKVAIDAQKAIAKQESHSTESNNLLTVHYQNEKTSMKKFLSAQEFHALKMQRDYFYKALQLWREHNSNFNFNFKRNIGPHVANIFKTSMHPTNMYHFARLFVNQLIISGAMNSQALQAEDDSNAQRINRLLDRMEKQSHFALCNEFPGEQQFFHDFIQESMHMAFMEQLKNVLYYELAMLNNSNFELINLIGSDDSELPVVSIDGAKHCEYVVRPATLATMQVLAKFLGFIVDLAIYNNWLYPDPVLQKQLVMYELFPPVIDLAQVLQDAIKSNKLLITLPWLVQYLAILKDTTLTLRSYASLLEKLFDLYIEIGLDNVPIASDSKFLIRCCIGWLLDCKPTVAKKYTQYRLMQSKHSLAKSADMKQVTCLIPESFEGRISIASDSLIIDSLEPQKDGSYRCTIRKRSPLWPIVQDKSFSESMNSIIADKVLLSDVYQSVCPYLMNFRARISPVKKAMNRNAVVGRRIEIAPPKENVDPANERKNQNSQKILIDAFLHSQDMSLRRLIEFITERTYKCVVKSLQARILDTIKADAEVQINQLLAGNHSVVEKDIIYEMARQNAMERWDVESVKMVNSRVQSALTALLPEGFNETIKSAYFSIIKMDVSQKLEQWRYDNIVMGTFAPTASLELAIKPVKAQSEQDLTANELMKTNTEYSMAYVIDELQLLLFATSRRPDLFPGADTVRTHLIKLEEIFENMIPRDTVQLIGSSIIQLAVQIICMDPYVLTNELMKQFCKVLRNETISNQFTMVSIVDRLVSVDAIEGLANRNECYNKYRDLLLMLLKYRIVKLDCLNSVFMSLYKHNWDGVTLQNISGMLNVIAKRAVGLDDDKEEIASGSDECASNYGDFDEKEALFMEVLADLARDIDF